MERLVVALLLHLFGVLQCGTQQLVIDACSTCPSLWKTRAASSWPSCTMLTSPFAVSYMVTCLPIAAGCVGRFEYVHDPFVVERQRARDLASLLPRETLDAALGTVDLNQLAIALTPSSGLMHAALSLQARHPKLRLDTILGAYHAPTPGNTLALTVDHDPSCMYYTLEATEPKGSFAFETLEHGPEVWRAEVKRL